MKKKIFWALITTMTLGGGWMAFDWWWRPSTQLQALALVPNDAFYILETNQPIENWKVIRQLGAWQHLRTQPYIASLTQGLNSLDSLLDNNEVFFNFFGNRKVWVSAHRYRPTDYDFLLITDLGQAARLTAAKEFLLPFAQGLYQISRREYQSRELIELTDRRTKETLTMCFVDNLLLLSWTPTIVENAIAQMQEPFLARDWRFRQVSREVSDTGLFRLYVNYAQLEPFSQVYTGQSNDLLADLGEQLAFTGLFFRPEGTEILRAEGMTVTNDTVPSYLGSLLKSGQGRIQAPDMAPQRTGFVLSLGFSEFRKWFFHSLDMAEKLNPDQYKETMGHIETVEKFLDVSLDDHLFSWIGQEVGFVQLQASGLGRDNEFAVLLHAPDMKAARSGLDAIGRQIRRKTPVKIREVNYRGHPIRFISMKGFFRLFLGKLFARLEKPYYTFIGEFVVLSNHPATLRAFIDAWEDGTTLGKEERFQTFRQHFSKTANVFAYVNTPVLTESARAWVSTETWQSMQQNKPYLLSFSQWGLQLEPKNDAFATRLICQFTPPERLQPFLAMLKKANPTPELTASLDGQEVPAVQAFSLIGPQLIDEEELLPATDLQPDDLTATLHQERYPNGKVKLEVGLKNGVKNGVYREFYESGELKVKGRFKDDLQDGIWKTFSPEGKTIERKRYRAGKELN